MPDDAAARRAAFGQQPETMLLDALLGLAGFQCCSVSKQAHSAPRSELNTDPSVRGDHSSPGSPKRRVSSKASASSRDKAPPAGPRLPEADHHRAEAGAEPTPPLTPPPTSTPKSAAGAWATEGTAAVCAARHTACRSTALDEGAGGPSQPTIVGRPFSSRTMQQYLKARERRQDTMFRLEQRLVEITCEYGEVRKALKKGINTVRLGAGVKGGLRVVSIHHAKENLLLEAKEIRATLHEMRGQVARLQECIDVWCENAQ